MPLPDFEELPGILADRGSYVSYAVRSSLWYGLIPHGKGTTVYDAEVSPQEDRRH